MDSFVRDDAEPPGVAYLPLAHDTITAANLKTGEYCRVEGTDDDGMTSATEGYVELVSRAYSYNKGAGGMFFEIRIDLCGKAPVQPNPAY